MLRHVTRVKHTVRWVVGSRMLSSMLSPSERPILTLYTMENCSLCDDAKEVLKRYPNKFTLEEVDITAPQNKHWYKQYRYEIPVFHLQGQFLMKHRVDTKLLEQKLDEHHSKMKLPEG